MQQQQCHSLCSRAVEFGFKNLGFKKLEKQDKYSLDFLVNFLFLLLIY